MIESLNLNFGGGLRSCPGKSSFILKAFPRTSIDVITDLAEAIYSKMIPILLGDFDWSLARPEKEPFMRGTFTVRLVEEMMLYKHRG